ncbi:hypothetical protein Tco_0356695 [Tanacetum coccineum]
MIHLTSSRLARKDEETVSFIKELGHKGDIKSITEVVVDEMYQPWRTFAAIINRLHILNRKQRHQEARENAIPDSLKLSFITSLLKTTDDFQVYGALLPEVMTNQKMRNSPTYKTYLAYVTGAVTPKKARKFKKPSSPSKKRTLVTVEEEEPKPAKKKKAPATTDRSKGINLLSEAALLEEAQGDSGDEANVQGDDEDVQDSDDDPQQADDERTDSENQETNDDEKESDNKFVHTPPNYVPTDDETNDESNDVDEEKYDRIDKELYGDVNVRLKDAKHNDEEKGDADMTNAAHVQVKQTQEQTTGIQEESGLKMESIQVVSMLDINVQHEVPCTSPLLTIPVYVVPEHTMFHLSKTVTTALATTITSLLLSLFPYLQQSIPIPTPTNIETTTSTIVVSESKTLSTLHQRITDLEKDVKELKNVDNSTTVISIIKSKVPNDVKEYLGSNLDDALYKKTTLFNIMTKSKSFYKSPKHKALSHALMESILEDEDAMDKGVASELKKRKPNDADKDEGPTVGSDRGLKRQRISKGLKPLRRHSDYAKHDDAKFDNTDIPMDQGEDLGKTDEQPKDEVVPNNDWYKKSRSDTSPDLEWNEGKLVYDGIEQCWLNDLAKSTKPPLTFDELMHSPIDFSAFAMNRLKIDNLTKEHLVGSVYNLLKGTCKSYVELDHTMEECYHALSKQLDWNNPKGHRCPYDLTKPLPVQMSSQGHQIIPVDFFFNKDLEYLRGRSNDKKYTASMTKSKAARYELKGIEDMVPNLWSTVKFVYDRSALFGISYWRTKRHNLYSYITKMVSKYDVYSTKRILSIISVKVNEWYKYGYLEEIIVKREDQKLYTFKEVNLRMFARRTVIQARVEDLQLGVESYHKKLNLTKPRT